MRYKCAWTKESGIQDLEEGPNKLPRLPCRFMRYSMGQIFIETAEGFKPATLMGADSTYEHMPDEIIRNDKVQQSPKLEKLKSTHDEKQSETRVIASNIIANAESEKVDITANEANTQDISANRDAAIMFEVADSQNKFHEHASEGSPDEVSKDIEPENETEFASKEEPNPTATLFAEKMANNRNSRSRRGK